MKQLIQNLKNGKLKLKDVPYPLCKDDGIIVRNEYSVISAGTEKSIINLSKKSILGKAKARPDLFKRAWDKAKKEGFLKVFKESMMRLDEPFPLGYSASAEVVEIGKEIDDVCVGDRVAVWGSGFANHSEYNFIPKENYLKIDSVDLEDSSFCMIGGIVKHSIDKAEVKKGDTVGVIGLGLLGLIEVQILKAMGCQVVGIDIDDKKIEKGKEIGCDYVFNALEENGSDLVDSVTGNKGLEGVIITADSSDSSPLDTAQKIAGKGAVIVLTGVCDISLERKYMWDKEIVFKVSKSAGDNEKENIKYFLDLIKDEKINLKEIITHRFNFDNALSGYGKILKGKVDNIGVVLDYRSGSKSAPEKTVVLNEKKKSDKKINVGVIGGGQFARNIFLPQLSKQKNINLAGIAASTGMSSEHSGERFGFGYSTTDYKKILDDKDIDRVFILTRHNLHAPMVIEGLEKGKNIYVEKPLCLNKQELEEIKNVYNDSNNKLMVGFNRRYSAHAKDIKEFFTDNEPLVINARINAGFIDYSHWTQEEEQGGRIIGEMCHFVDLMQYITSSVPVQVYASGIRGSGKFKNDDNLGCIIKFEDGSAANIVYTSKGSKKYPREMFEIYQNESVYYLEDFKKALKVKSGKKKKNNLSSQDMG
ncbi:MAG: bi-domain-containing oxidoreductase, partial [Atribacterota bacterium]